MEWLSPENKPFLVLKFFRIRKNYKPETIRNLILAGLSLKIKPIFFKATKCLEILFFLSHNIDDRINNSNFVSLSGSASAVGMRILETKMMQIHADADPQRWV
jgi:hypothetical protein